MDTVARLIAMQMIAEFGGSAQARAMSLSEATGLYGSAECADFYDAVAEIIGDAEAADARGGPGDEERTARQAGFAQLGTEKGSDPFLSNNS
jgi:hypothetical protein